MDHCFRERRDSFAWTRVLLRKIAAPLVGALAVTLPAPAQSFCEPLAGTPLFCPCGNFPSGPGRGCDNSNATGGASIGVSGSPSISNDTLIVTITGVGNTGPSCSSPTGNVPSVLLQGNLVIPGAPFFDGVRCVGGNLKRIEGAFSISGVFTSTVGISLTSAALGDVLSSGSIRYYFLYYRDPCPTFACTGALDLSNASNAYKITWTP
jgi:hypothetical protein